MFVSKVSIHKSMRMRDGNNLLTVETIRCSRGDLNGKHALFNEHKLEDISMWVLQQLYQFTVTALPQCLVQSAVDI